MNILKRSMLNWVSPEMVEILYNKGLTCYRPSGNSEHMGAMLRTIKARELLEGLGKENYVRFVEEVEYDIACDKLIGKDIRSKYNFLTYLKMTL